MRKFTVLTISTLACCAAFIVGAAQQEPVGSAVSATLVAGKSPLVFDSLEKTYTTKPDETMGQFSFWLTNTGPSNVVVTSVHATCGCTTPSLPPLPWTLKPGESGEIKATMDMKHKSGTQVKHISVTSSVGQQTLQVKTIITPNADAMMGERQKNVELAKADRQAIFKDKCVDCHFTPVLEQTTGEGIYLSACAICHEPEKWAQAAGKPPEIHHRAEMVPDLAKLKMPMTRQAWKITTANGGKPGTLMPAFSKRNGGPLTDTQLETLTEYLVKQFPFNPANLTNGIGQPVVPVKSPAAVTNASGQSVSVPK